MFASPTRSTASVIRRLTRVAAVSTAAAVAASTLAVSSWSRMRAMAAPRETL